MWCGEKRRGGGGERRKKNFNNKLKYSSGSTFHRINLLLFIGGSANTYSFTTDHRGDLKKNSGTLLRNLRSNEGPIKKEEAWHRILSLHVQERGIHGGFSDDVTLPHEHVLRLYSAW